MIATIDRAAQFSAEKGRPSRFGQDVREVVRASVSIDGIFALATLTALAGSTALAAPNDDCRLSAPRQDRIRTVGPRGEIEWESGTRAVLADLHWPEDEAVARDARAWLKERRERPITVTVRGGTDRWGRERVDAAEAGEGGGDLAGGLIGEGLALADAGEADLLCRKDLLTLENGPRKAGRGVWATPVREARDGKALEAVEGDFVLVQGRVLHVGERPRRTYLNFSRRGEPGLSVTVPKRTWRIMQERGLSAAALKGRFVRIRGRVEVWRGPVIDVASADMIEVLEGQAAAGDEALRR